MKKINSILSATLMLVCCLVLSLGAISCNKTKNCSCTETTGTLDKTTEVTIEKGDCSDSNDTSTKLLMGHTVTVKKVCVEV